MCVQCACPRLHTLALPCATDRTNHTRAHTRMLFPVDTRTIAHSCSSMNHSRTIAHTRTHMCANRILTHAPIVHALTRILPHTPSAHAHTWTHHPTHRAAVAAHCFCFLPAPTSMAIHPTTHPLPPPQTRTLMHPGNTLMYPGNTLLHQPQSCTARPPPHTLFCWHEPIFRGLEHIWRVCGGI